MEFVYHGGTVCRPALLVVGFAACVGDISNPPGQDAAPADSAGSVAGTVFITARTQPTTAPQNFAPANASVVWVENTGTFVKTIDRQADVRKPALNAWRAVAGLTDTDAMTGASRKNHLVDLSITWDLKDKSGTVIPDGTYTIRMEVADSNASTPAQNNEGTFTFVKGPAAQMQTGLSNGGFTNVMIRFTPSP